MGFLSDNRRINVGVTRAKRHLAVIGDSQTCGADPFLRSLLDHITTHGDYITGEEFVELSVAGVSPLTAAASQPRDQKAGLSSDMKGRKGALDKAKPQEVRVELTEIEAARFLKVFLSGDVKQGHVQLLNDGKLSLTKKKLSRPFTTGGGRLLRFPRTFTSFQRMQVHAVCEQLHLYHRSSGEGAERIIEVCTVPFDDDEDESPAKVEASKPVNYVPSAAISAPPVVTPGQVTGNVTAVDVRPISAAQQPPLPPEDSEIVSGDCKTQIGDAVNDAGKIALKDSAAFLQQLHLSRKAEKERAAAAAAAASAKAVANKPKKGPNLTAPVEESEDDLLDALIAENKVSANLVLEKVNF